MSSYTDFWICCTLLLAHHCRILFWTDWDASLPRIEAASMSGEGRKTIHKETGNGGWPNGLTVDYLERRILWIDARLNREPKRSHGHLWSSSCILEFYWKITDKLCRTQVWCHLFSQVWRFGTNWGSAGPRVSVTSVCCHHVWRRGVLDGLENKHVGQGKQVDWKQCHCGTENQHTTLRPAGLPSIQTASG